MKELIAYHMEKYPQMQVQDMIKLLFQSEFGPGHLIEHLDWAEKMLLDEIEITQNENYEIVPVSKTLVRLHLGNFTKEHVPMILNAMIQSAESVKPDKERFLNHLMELEKMNLFPLEEVQSFLKEYLQRESLMISHTQQYRDLYHPHYRILTKELAEKVIDCIR